MIKAENLLKGYGVFSLHTINSKTSVKAVMSEQ